MKYAITTLSFLSLIGFSAAAWAAGDFDKSSFAGIPGIELGTRLHAESKREVQASAETLSEAAVATPQAPRERKVRIVYPLPK